MSTQPQAAPAPPGQAPKRPCSASSAGELLRREVHKVIIGQEQMIEEMLICLFARGHCLTIGVPGLAKTLTVSTLARALHLKFNRIQFTPDLMPSDITGTEIIEEDVATGKRGVPLCARGRSSPTSCSPTRSTGPRPRPRRHFAGHAGVPGYGRLEHLRP